MFPTTRYHQGKIVGSGKDRSLDFSGIIFNTNHSLRIATKCQKLHCVLGRENVPICDFVAKLYAIFLFVSTDATNRRGSTGCSHHR